MSEEPTEAHNRSESEPTPEATIPKGTWRSLLVPFGPSVALDLLLGACVVATALGALPDPSRGRIARLIRRGGVRRGAPAVGLLADRPPLALEVGHHR